MSEQPARAKTVRTAQAEHAPWKPAQWEKADANAVRAMAAGEADPEQQRRALQWIIESAAGTYDAHYFPTDRETAFALGRAHVGQQIVKLIKLNPKLVRSDEHA